MATAMVDATAKVQSGENHRIEVSKVIRAKRARVFDAWTKPEIIRHWFGPGNMVVEEVTADVRVGGSYRIAMRGALEACLAERANESRDYVTAASGTYTEIVPDERIAFTWQGKWCAEEVSHVTVTLKDVEGGTEVRLVHERFATEDSAKRHEHGWTGSLKKLAEVMEG